MRLVLDGMVQDIRFALRGLSRNRAFTATALLATALGTGATTAVFSVVNQLMFRNLPYADTDRLVSVGIVAPLIDSQDWVFWGTYQQWRAAQQPFEPITSWLGVSECDLAAGTPARLDCARVEANFLETLGVKPVIGRNFTREEDVAGAAPVAILSHALWTNRFGSDPKTIGASVELNGVATRVVGVLPSGFALPNLARADVLVPQALPLGSQRQRVVKVFGRLRPGWTISTATNMLYPLFQDFIGGAPTDFRNAVGMRLRVQSLSDYQNRDRRLASQVLIASVLAVLLIGCANVASLLLARSAVRRNEFTVRAAIGAGRIRLVRQVITESLVLAIVGGVAGCCAAWMLLRMVISIAPESLLQVKQSSLDVGVLLFASAVALMSGLLFGLAPAVQASRLNFSTRTSTPRNARGRKILVAAQVAASLVLLSGSGLLLLSLWKLQNSRLMLGGEQVITASFTLAAHRYPQNEQQLLFFRELESRLKQIPGVISAAITDTLPPAGDPRSRPFVAFRNPGGNQADQGMDGLVFWRYVTADYFAAMGIPIIRGRAFREEDINSGEPVTIINQALASRMFPGQDPIGRRLGGDLIIGLAEDVQNAGVGGRVEPEHYVLRGRTPDNDFRNQRPPFGWRRAIAVIRTSTDAGFSANWVRLVVRELDSTLPVVIEPLHQQIGRMLQGPRFHTVLILLFAGIAIALAGIGLYGLVSCLVTERTQEMAVRMALGATPAAILQSVLAEAGRWTTVGAIIGILLSAWSGRALAWVIPGAPAINAAALAGAMAFLFLVVLAAAWIPARRAARIDPIAALRHD